MFINLYIGPKYESEFESTKFKLLTAFYVYWINNPFRGNDFVIEYIIVDDSLVVAERISSGFFIYTEHEKEYPKLDWLTVLNLYNKCKEFEEKTMLISPTDIPDYIPNYKEMDWGIYKIYYNKE